MCAFIFPVRTQVPSPQNMRVPQELCEPCMEALSSIVRGAPFTSLQAVRQKYARAHLSEATLVQIPAYVAVKGPAAPPLA